MIRKSLTAKFKIRLFAGVLTDEHLKNKALLSIESLFGDFTNKTRN